MSFNLKAIFLLTFVGAALAAQELDIPIYQVNCPRIDDISNPVMLPYAPDCSKFYSCINGQAHLQHCPYNLQWSTTLYRCERPEIAQCQPFIQPIPVTPSIPPTYPYIPKNPEITYQRNPNDCNKYYQCQAVQCPSNLYWNSYTQQCDYPQNVQCTYSPLFQLADGTATGSK